MTLPSEIESFAGGWDLNLASYSTPGQPNGTFRNIIAGRRALQHGAGVPVFSSKGTGGSQIEGLDITASNFDNDKNTFRNLIGQECTFIAIIHRSVYTTNCYAVAPTDDRAGVNHWALMVLSTRKPSIYWNGWNEVGQSAAVPTDNVAGVIAGGFYPKGRKAWVKWNKTGPVEDVPNTPTVRNLIWNSGSELGVGSWKNTTQTQWIGRLLMFGESLYHRSPTFLDQLMTTECAKIGI
jgi:hypothetical protein